MLQMLFLGMLEASTAYYGDSIGLAPIALGRKSQGNDRTLFDLEPKEFSKKEKI